MSEEASKISYRPLPSAVFWDTVRYPFPDGLGPDLISKHIKSFIKSLDCHGELSIHVYIDEEKLTDELANAFMVAGINTHLREGDKFARVCSMLLDIGWWVVTRPSGYHQRVSLFVISEDSEEDEVLKKELRRLEDIRYNVFNSSVLRTGKFKWQTDHSTQYEDHETSQETEWTVVRRRGRRVEAAVIEEISRDTLGF